MSEKLTTQPAYEVAPPESPEQLQMPEDTVETALRTIDDTEYRVTHALNLEAGSPDATAETDRALLYDAEQKDAHGLEEEATDAYEAAVIEGALEAAHLKDSSGENPIITLELSGHDDDVTAVVQRLHETHAMLPNHIEAAPIVAQEIERLHSSIPVGEGGEVEYLPGVAHDASLEKAPKDSESYGAEQDYRVFVEDLKVALPERVAQLESNPDVTLESEIMLQQEMLRQAQLLEEGEDSVPSLHKMDTIRARTFADLARDATLRYEAGSGVGDAHVLAVENLRDVIVDFKQLSLDDADTLLGAAAGLDAARGRLDVRSILQHEAGGLTNSLVERMDATTAKNLYEVQGADGEESQLKRYLEAPTYTDGGRYAKLNMLLDIHDEELAGRYMRPGQDKAFDMLREEIGPARVAYLEAFRQSEKLPTEPENETPEAVVEFNSRYAHHLENFFDAAIKLPDDVVDRFSLAASSRMKYVSDHGHQSYYNRTEMRSSMLRMAENVDSVGSETLTRLHREMGVVNFDKYKPEDLKNLQKLLDADPAFINHLQNGDVTVVLADAYGDYNGALSNSFDIYRVPSGRSLMFELGNPSDIYRHMIRLKQLNVRPSTVAVHAHGAPGMTAFGQPGLNGKTGHSFNVVSSKDFVGGNRDVVLGDTKLDRLLSDEFMQPSRAIDDHETAEGKRRVILASCKGDAPFADTVNTSAEEIAKIGTYSTLSSHDLQVFAATENAYVAGGNGRLYMKNVDSEPIVSRVSIQGFAVERTSMSSVPLRKEV